MSLVFLASQRAAASVRLVWVFRFQAEAGSAVKPDARVWKQRPWKSTPDLPWGLWGHPSDHMDAEWRGG